MTSCLGWCHDSLPEHPELRGKQREAERVRLARPARGVRRAAVGRGDDGRVKEQAAVLGPFGERSGHERRGLTHLPGRGQCPRQRIEREDVGCDFHLTSGELDGLRAILAPRREVERKRARVAGRAVSDELLLERGGFVGPVHAGGARRRASTGIREAD